MKRELKPNVRLVREQSHGSIAEPIPMKRELKQNLFLRAQNYWSYCRAYPDEKGIETGQGRIRRAGGR